MAFEEECPRGWLWGCYADERKQKNKLSSVNNDLLSVVLTAHCLVPYNNPSFSDFGKTMYNFSFNTTRYNYLASLISLW